MKSLAHIKPALAGLVTVLALGGAGAPAHAALPQQSGNVDLGAAKPNASADGAASSDLSGTAVADAGDVNGDGLSDVVVGAPNADPNGRRDAGSAFVVFGRTDGVSVDLAKIGSGAGFRIDGAATTDRLGSTVSGAGDVNGDGLSDVIVGAREADNRGRSGSGSAYVIFGRAASHAVGVADLGSGGFRIDGAASGDRAATSVSGGVDVNRDGRSDVMVGAPLADPNARANSGAVYVVFGKSDGSGVDAQSLAGAGYVIAGAGAGDQLSGVAAVRDFTGDRRGEILTGARFADGGGRIDSGAAYLVQGKDDGGAVDLAVPGAAAYSAYGAAASDNAGATVASGGDVNGDGHGDLLLGAPGTDFNGRSASGSAYVLLSADAGGTHDLAALESTWRVDGAAAGDNAGSSLSAGADVNADGSTDLAVGSPFADRPGRTDAGGAAVLYGGSFSGVVDLASPPAGFRAHGGGGNEQAGSAVAMVADANGDGRGDALVGSPRADRAGRGDNGAAHFLWGYGPSNLAYPDLLATTVTQPIAPLFPRAIVRTGPVSFSIDPPLPDGLKLDPHTGVISGAAATIQELPATYRLTMTDLAGTVTVPVTLRVAPLPGRCANARAGTPQDDKVQGTSGGDRVTAAGGNDSVESVAGDDCVIGEAGLDVLAGGDGNDELRGGSEHDKLDGGPGADQLFGDTGQDALVAGDGPDVAHGGTGFDELSGAGGPDKLYGEADSDSILGGSGNDRVDGGGAADRLVGGSGRDVLIAGSGNDIVTDSSGGGKVDGGSGSDVISVRNGARDVVRCGKGRDRVTADRSDKLSSCEKVRRARAKKKKRRGRR